MVAFSKWQFPHTLTEQQQAKKKTLGQDNHFGDDAPEGYNYKLSCDFFEMIEKKHEKWVDDSKDYGKHPRSFETAGRIIVRSITCASASQLIDPSLVLHILAVSPHHQRKGLGALLIRDGLSLVDKHNARTYIEASPVGLQLYQRHGWKLIDDISIDMTPYGGTGGASEKILMRAPGGI